MRGMALLTLGISFGTTISAVAQHDGATERAPDAPIEPTPPALRVVITQEVYEELGRLAATGRLETVRCLIGAVRGDSLLVDLAWAPHIEHSTPESVRYRLCPVATIALWHNHPQAPDGPAESSCYLSRTDIEAALRSHAPPIQMVQVNAEVACWWSRVQVVRHADAEFIMPLPDQARGQTVHADTAACVAPLAHDCTRSEPCLESQSDRLLGAAAFTQRRRSALGARWTGVGGMTRYRDMGWGRAAPQPATQACAGVR